MSGDPAPAPKVDPGTLMLRGSPGRIVRFRRGLIIAVAALGSSAVAGVAWMALKPPSFNVGIEPPPRPAPSAKAPPDVLANAPRTYAEVPVLGPPLPGDLGRPILKHQRDVEAPPDREGLRQARERVEAERSALAAERKAARESGVLLPLARAAPPGADEAPDNPVAAVRVTRARDERLAPDDRIDHAGPPRHGDRFTGVGEAGDVNPHALRRPASPHVLMAGSVIAASLITGLNSDLPGLVTAQVTENAYDSATGRTLLIPQGSRLVGSYDNVVAFGQRRALVVWQRIILPDGSSLRIGNMPASDSGGYAGLADEVDRHSWQLLKGVALSTLLGVGAELSIGGEGELLRAVRESTQQGVARAGDQIVAKGLGIQPTITVRPGWPLRVLVSRDLVLPPWRG